MFYSENVLTRKGPLANIWLAAHWDRKLTKSQIVQTNIQSSVDQIVKGALPPMALRLSGQLLLGASRIYWRKARYLLEDCSETLDRLKLNFKIDGQVDMPQDQSRAPISSITLATNYNAAANNLMLPEPDLDLDEILNMVSTQQPQALGKPVNGKDYDNSINLKEKFNMNKSFGFDKSDQNDSLLQAFPMNEDFEIEAGRRLTDTSVLGMSRDSNPFVSRDSISTSAFGLEDPSGIEVGRRESVASAFSPMRLSTPGKMASETPADFDMNDHFTWDAGNEQAAVASPLAADAPFNTPPRPVAKKNVTRKRKVALDEVTELSSTQIQKQVKDTSDIVVDGNNRTKRANVDDALVPAADESRRLSMSSAVAPEEIAAILARPAFDGDMVMDAFGDLFKDNPLAVASVAVSTPMVSKVASVLESELTPMPASFAADMIGDDMYDGMNPEPAMPEFFENEPFQSDSNTNQINVFDIISASKKAVTFQSILSGHSRSTVAKSFFDVLALSSKGMISAKQSQAFGQIELVASS